MLVSLFARYVSLERFPISAFVNIGLTYLLSLSSLGLLGLDLAYTLYTRGGDDRNILLEYQGEVRVLWTIVYWGSLATGTICSTFLTRYWQSGHF